MSTTSDTSDRVPAGAPAGRRAVRRIAMLVAATAALAISAVAPGTALGRDTGAGSPAGTVRDFRTALWAARLRLAGRLIDQESAVKGLAYRAEQRGPRRVGDGECRRRLAHLPAAQGDGDRAERVPGPADEVAHRLRRRATGGPMSRAPRSIIAPVTLAGESTEIVSAAGALAETLGAELVLVGIAPLAPRVRAAAQAGHIPWLAPDDQQRLLDALVRERVDELHGSLPAGVRARTLLTWGALGAALVAAARDEQAELIVVAMRREGVLGHALHDRADRHVLHHSDVPVLVVPTGRDAFSDRPTGESRAGSAAGTLAARRQAGFVEARTQQPSRRGSAVHHGATPRGDAPA